MVRNKHLKGSEWFGMIRNGSKTFIVNGSEWTVWIRMVWNGSEWFGMVQSKYLKGTE